jgi:hypothetical protein
MYMYGEEEDVDRCYATNSETGLSIYAPPGTRVQNYDGGYSYGGTLAVFDHLSYCAKSTRPKSIVMGPKVRGRNQIRNFRLTPTGGATTFANMSSADLDKIGNMLKAIEKATDKTSEISRWKTILVKV